MPPDPMRVRQASVCLPSTRLSRAEFEGRWPTPRVSQNRSWRKWLRRFRDNLPPDASGTWRARRVGQRHLEWASSDPLRVTASKASSPSGLPSIATQKPVKVGGEIFGPQLRRAAAGPRDSERAAAGELHVSGDIRPAASHSLDLIQRHAVAGGVQRKAPVAVITRGMLIGTVKAHAPGSGLNDAGRDLQAVGGILQLHREAVERLTEGVPLIGSGRPSMRASCNVPGDLAVGFEGAFHRKVVRPANAAISLRWVPCAETFASIAAARSNFQSARPAVPSNSACQPPRFRLARCRRTDDSSTVRYPRQKPGTSAGRKRNFPRKRVRRFAAHPELRSRCHRRPPRRGPDGGAAGRRMPARSLPRLLDFSRTRNWRPSTPAKSSWVEGSAK